MPLTKEKNKTLSGEAGGREETAGKRAFSGGKEKSGSVWRLGSHPRRFECGNIGHGRNVGRF